MSPNEMMAATLNAEKQGVLVDWRSVAITVYNNAAEEIAALNKKIEALSEPEQKENDSAEEA